MKIGFVGSFGSVDQIIEMAVTAEKTGWDGFFTWDGLSVGPVDTFDPWVVLGAVAACTERITLGAMVFALARRTPWKVVRETITVDQLSHGRLVVPVGLGAVDDGGFARVSGMSTDRRTRAERLDETLEILDLAWRGESFSYQGKHHQATDLVFRPTPVSRPRIPIWTVGAFPSDRSMRRAARWDGVICSKLNGGFDPVQPSDVGAVVRWLAENRSAETPFDIVVEGRLPSDPSDAADRLAGLEAAGATWWIESRWDGPASEPDALMAMAQSGPPQW